MRRSNDGRRLALASLILAAVALSAPLSAQAVVLKPSKPRVSTGAVTHVRGTSGQLEGKVNPVGLETTYYFQYGPTIAYGMATPVTPAGAGTLSVKVGQTVTGLLAGYHYRLVASNSAGLTLGADRLFAPKATTNKIELSKEPIVDVFGTPFFLSGRISGTGNAGRRVVLQSSPFPYLEPFVTVSTPAVTNAAGAFSFRVSNLFRSAQLRVSTLDPRPLYSPLIRAQVAVRVSFHARSAGHGLVRLYGTVTPALRGAFVHFQVAKAVRPGVSEKTVAFSTQFTTSVKHATHSFSRFSMVVRLRLSGNYRALVKPPAGPYVTGSSAHLKLHAAPAPSKTKRK
jgi:hypothetical protein